MGENIQFDASENIIGDINIIEAQEWNQNLYFNESYIVVGGIFKAPFVNANYNLIVIGDLEVDIISVKSNLSVFGNIKAKEISCLKTIFCRGNVDADIIVGDEIIANNITCKELECTGNVIVCTSIDARNSIAIDGSLLSGEGIIGNGQFSAKNAVATEYFSFDGELRGKILELDSGETFGGEQVQALSNSMSLENLVSQFKTLSIKGIKNSGDINEDTLIEYVKNLSAMDEDFLSDWNIVLNSIVDISYLDKITNLRDYLYIIMAKNILPSEIIQYETLEHVFNKLLKEAENEVINLPFLAKDIEDFEYSLKIIFQCENELKMNQDDLLDRVFQSIGIKYKTVQTFLDKE